MPQLYLSQIAYFAIFETSIIKLLMSRLKNMNNQIVGRKKEISALEQAFSSSEAELIAIYGRRRVGKTYLIRHFFKQKKAPLFQLTGIHNAKLKTQLSEFTKELETLYEKLNIKVQLKPTTTWLDAFEALTDAINTYNKKIVIFFDEFPWMATKKSQLLQALDYYWNRYWVDNPNIKLIICGSAASWIIENILNNKGGLHNRVTLRLPIAPFTLSETKQYLNNKAITLDHYQIIQLYMCIGGIPFYLKFIKNGLSAIQNINEICFSKGGALVDEFSNLFSSLFKHSETHEKVITLLAHNRNGISRANIVKESGLNGGALTRVLKELEYAGFIEKFIPWKQKNGVSYKLIDEYSLFYLHWIAPSNNSNTIKEMSTDFWQATSLSSAWEAWSGYAFEAICFKHLSNIKAALSIPSGSVVSTWRHQPKKNEKASGAQIDLLFDRPDGLINICEIKYHNNAFNIDKEYSEKLRKKIDVYKHVTKTKKQLSLSMITTHGLTNSVYRTGLVWSDATADDLF
ncbi:MAG: ATP-binding protein [Coxiellaceae bacterium]|nr:ATP-binding protein [Coxiellaceae bacterium]